MSQTSTPHCCTTTLALSGTPTAITLGGDCDPVEIWVQAAAAIGVQGVNPATGAVDAAVFSLAANAVHRLPCNRTAAMRFTGSGTMSVMVFSDRILNPNLRA